MIRRIVSGVVVGLALTCGPLIAQTKTTTLIVPSTAGGTQDKIARLLATSLAERLGQPFVVINKPGAGGVIGTVEVARSAPDGLTLGVVYDSHAVNHLLYPNVQYDTFKSFDHVSLLVTASHVLVTSSQLPFKTLDDLLSVARSGQGKVSYGAIGGASTTLYAAMLADKAGAKMVQVPYNGGGGAYATDMLAGRFDFAIASLPAALPFIQSGKLRALAFGGTKRSALLPNIPTLSETFPGFTAEAWVGLIAPAGLEPAQLTHLSTAVNKALNTEPLRGRLVAEGFTIQGSTPKEFIDKVKEDAIALAPLIQSLSNTK